MDSVEKRREERAEKMRLAKERTKKRKTENEKKKSSGGGNFQFDEIAYTALSADQGKVVRLLGTPIEVQDDFGRKPYDPKVFYHSTILGDNDKKFRCVWPDPKKDNDWILWRILNLVKTSEYDSSIGKRVPVYDKSHPECFFRVAKNNSSHKAERGWQPSRTVAWNVIDRHDEEYHKKNNRTKLLSKKVGESHGKFFYEPGVPHILYESIFDSLVEFYGDYELYDTVIFKTTSMPFYTVKHGVEHAKEIGELTQFVKDRMLTEEEMNYNQYNVDKLFPITSYSKIKFNLGKFIKKVDADFDKNFYEELEELVEAEKKEKEANPITTFSVIVNVNGDPVETDTSAKNKKEAPAPKQEEETPVRRPKPKREEPKEEEVSADIPWDKLADGSYNGKEYLGVPKMTDEEKKMVKAVKDDGSFDYVDEWKGKKLKIMKNVENDFFSPDIFHVCPLSGTEWDD